MFVKVFARLDKRTLRRRGGMMKKHGIIIIIISILILLLTCVVWGFCEQIAATGFNPSPLLFAITVLSSIFMAVGILTYVGAVE